MYLKRYTIAAAILIILVGWYVYAFVTHDSMSIEIFGIDLPSLSIAIWIIIPLVVLYVGSVAHMAFYSLLNSFQLRKYEKDYDNLMDSFVDAYLSKQDRVHTFKTHRYQLLGTLIDNATISPYYGTITTNAKISAVMDAIEKVKNGEVVDLKAYSLKEDNALVIQNNRNRYKNEVLSAEDILTDVSQYTPELCKEVYCDFVGASPLYTIEQYKEFMTKDALYKILNRVNASKNTLEISNESLIKLFNILNLDSKDYIEISIALSHGMIPEQRIKLFETISESNDDAMEAYLFTLFDLEMISKAKEILDISQQDEYINFKAYAALKDSNKNFSIHLFV